MKIKVSYISKWIGTPPIHFCQLVEVWFGKEEFYNYKRNCYQRLSKYYDFFDIEMALTSEERDTISDILKLKEIDNYKFKRNTLIIYHKDNETW